jgi:hypothetical protein
MLGYKFFYFTRIIMLKLPKKTCNTTKKVPFIECFDFNEKK